MREIPDDKYHHAQAINEDGWIIGMYRAMFGVRVVVYRDNITINGSFCAGSDPVAQLKLYAHIYGWLQTNPKDVEQECRRLHSLEKTRPWGQCPEFIEAIEDLNCSENE